MKSLKLPALSSCALLLALLAPLTGLVSCSRGNPVAPTGTILTITASPSRIDLNGSTTIIVTGRRPDGNPLPSGTEIRFSASLGTIETLVETDASGIARAILRGDGRNGTATVTASAGDAEATIDVPIGEPPETAPNVTVSVNPDNIPVGEDSTATVTIIVRNPDNTPAGANLEVVLTTTLGTLDPERPLTDSTGTAKSTLSAGLQSGTAEITAFVGNSDPETTTLTIRESAADISLQPNPASIPRTDTDIVLLAFVSNSQGLPLQGQSVTFRSEIGRFGGSNIAFTNTNGQAQVTLSVTQGDLGNRPSFMVTAETPSGNGQLISATAVITIQ